MLNRLPMQKRRQLNEAEKNNKLQKEELNKKLENG